VHFEFVGHERSRKKTKAYRIVRPGPNVIGRAEIPFPLIAASVLPIGTVIHRQQAFCLPGRIAREADAY
jgi:hypothetical protein